MDRFSSPHPTATAPTAPDTEPVPLEAFQHLHMQQQNAQAISTAMGAVGASSIRRARKQGMQYQTFPLPRTGGAAKVRRPSMLALAASGTLPDHLQQYVQRYTGVGGGGRITQEEVKDLLGDDPLGHIFELIDHTCIFGFVDPRLVPTGGIVRRNEQREWPGVDAFIALEEQGWQRLGVDGAPITDPNTMFVDEIDRDDRLEFFMWCQGAVREVAAAAAPFLEEPGDTVSPGADRANVRR